MPVEVDYQVQYALCSLFFLIIVALHFFSVRRFPSITNKLFGVILILAAADIALDIASSFTIMHANEVGAAANYILNSLFYIIQVIFPVLPMTYVLYSMGLSYHRRRSLLVLLIPAAVFILLLVSNLFTHIFFYIGEYGGVLRYFRGALFPLMYIDTAFYLSATVILLLRSRGRVDDRARRTLLSFVLITVFTAVLQFFFPNLLLTSVSLSISILLGFFTLQNPEDMLDLVSGVFNYNAMTTLLESFVQSGERIFFATIDVGGMRRVNSSYGQSVGNDVMAKVGGYLNSLGRGLWVFRMTGTRFAIISSSSSSVLSAVDSVQERFSSPWNDGRHVHSLIATVRYFCRSGVFNSFEDVISMIDESFAEIGTGGWGACLPIEDDILERSRRRAKIDEEMRAALAGGNGFSLRYHPIYDIEHDCLAGAEALLRLESRELGHISPSEFIPIAEKSGLIVEIDQFVIRTAMEFLSKNKWPKFLNVNLSAAEFYRNPAEMIDSVVSEFGVAKGRICFEVTETASSVYPKMLSEFMGDMIARGYHFALDDFGTGYANFAQVSEMPFAVAKLDKALLEDTPKTRLLFRCMAKMFAETGIRTVAEGIETEDQFNFAKDEVDFMQGYYFAKPMTESEYRDFYAAKG